MNISNLRNRVMISMLFGIVVFAALLAYGDFQEVAESFGEFEWWLLPPILLVTCGNYALRFVKWEYYLRQIGVVGLHHWDSFLIYFSGLGMTVTPGKVGEWLKSYLLKEVHGTPVTRSAPILLAERLTDSVALLIIGGFGVVAFGRDLWWVVAVIAGISLLGVGVARHRPTAMAIIRMLQRIRILQRFTGHIDEFYESAYTLLDPKGLVLMTGLSVGSWFFEVLAFHMTLVGVGAPNDLDTLSKAAFILPISTLAAAIVVFAPGGLGVAEAGITGLTKELLNLSRSASTVGTVIIRIATLWFGVIIGLIAFAVLTRKLQQQGISLDADLQLAAEADPFP